jgi:hypothetical protein
LSGVPLFVESGVTSAKQSPKVYRGLERDEKTVAMVLVVIAAIP